MPASQNAHEIVTPVLVVVAFAGSCFSWILAAADDVSLPYPVLVGSISTIGMTLIVLYGKFREIKIEKDRQERIACADQKNDKLVQLIKKLCERMRRHEMKIRRLEARIQEAVGAHPKAMDAKQDEPPLRIRSDNTPG